MSIDFVKLEGEEITNELELRKDSQDTIQSMYMDGKCLLELPLQFRYFTSTIKNLVLNNNSFQEIPEILFECRRLQILDLNANSIRHIPSEYKNWNQLEQLQLANNQITQLPKEGFALPRLHYLDVSGNQLQTIPSPIFQIKSLKRLNVSRNVIEILPDIVQSHLQYLNASHNRLRTMPGFSGTLGLELLDLSYNQISHISENGFDSLYALKSLYLNDNPLQELSDLSDLICLQLLDISNTLVTTLHPSIATLAHLQVLQLISPLPSVSIFQFGMDPTHFAKFEYPPPHICCSGTAAIASYLKQHRVIYSDTNKSGISDTLRGSITQSDSHIQWGTVESENGSKGTATIPKTSERCDQDPPFPTNSINRHVFHQKMDDHFEPFTQALLAKNSELVQKYYQQLMLKFFDSIHLLVVPAFCPISANGGKSSLSHFTFKLDTYLASYSSLNECIRYQVVTSIVQFTETVLLNALFIRHQILAQFKLFKKSVKSFYQWILGVAPSSPPRFVSIERLILIYDSVHRVESDSALSGWIRNQIHESTKGDGSLTPQQILKWLSIISKGSKNANMTWFESIRAEFSHFLKSRRSTGVFRDVQALEPLRLDDD
jgi:Leucine-rich repeat (LRR) protein